MASTEGRSRRIAVVGGYGAFGSRVAELLMRDSDITVVIAGRNGRRAQAAATALAKKTLDPVHSAILDAEGAIAPDVSALDASVIINASGPFQSGSYRLARACIAAGCHYIDLADARGFVTGISALDAEAQAAGILVVSGASSVPGLSSAVVDAYARDFDTVTSIDIGISPGNSFDPGEATVRAVLEGVGAPMRMRIGGDWSTVHGWQGLQRRDFGIAGRRFLGYVDVPDLDLFPARYPSCETVRFQAGLEVVLFHLGLWGASWLVRGGLAQHLDRLAGPLLAVKRQLAALGTDRGGMFVDVEGYDKAGDVKRVSWLLVASNGHGPYVPALASVALARRLVRGTETRRGATPCFGLVSLDDFARETQGLDISWTCT